MARKKYIKWRLVPHLNCNYMFGKKAHQPKWLFCGSSNRVESDFGHVVSGGGRKLVNPESPVKNHLRDRERREPGEGWIGTQAGTAHQCAMSSLNMIGQIKVTVYLQYKRSSASGLNCVLYISKPLYQIKAYRTGYIRPYQQF